MKKKSVLFVVLVCLVISFFVFPIQSSDECNAPPPKGPPPDNADDNFSFNLQGVQTSANPYYVERYPFIGILKNGNTAAMDNLLSKIGRQCLYVDEDFNPQESLKKINLLIIPTGGLWGTGNSTYFKTLLENFLNSGGHILCFAQQDFFDFQAIPAPAGNYETVLSPKGNFEIQIKSPRPGITGTALSPKFRETFTITKIVASVWI